MNTKVIARPRCAGATSKLMHEAACGVKIAGASAASMRATKSAPKSGMQALASRKTPYHSKDSASKRRRSHPATSVAHKGAPRHITTAAAVMSCPATGTETCKSALMSLSVPGTTMTPVPITKLPNNKGHSTLGRGASAGRSAVSWGEVMGYFVARQRWAGAGVNGW